MRNPKHRWTLEEENALRAGVDKYGTGKWRKILSDEEFAPCLIGRSNVDLKDKWRNLCGNASSRAASPQCLTDKETGPLYPTTLGSYWLSTPWYNLISDGALARYNATIFEALSSTDNSKGLDVDAIHSYTQNVVGEAVEEAEVKIDEAVVRDYVQVLREVGYKEHEINVAVEHTEVVHEEAVINEHVGIAMSMNTEDSQETSPIKDSQKLILKPKLLQKLVFKALKKLGWR